MGEGDEGMTQQERAILLEGILMGSAFDNGGAPTDTARDLVEELADRWHLDIVLRAEIAAALTDCLEKVL